MDEVKRSRKSKIKKRPDDWEQLKVELAKELGIWPIVRKNGWAGLSAEDSGRLGGVFAARREALRRQAAGEQAESSELPEVISVGTATDDDRVDRYKRAQEKNPAE